MMSGPLIYVARRWVAHRFRTRVRYQPDPFGRPECWYVERPDWWTRGARSGVTDVSPETARQRLNEWQDDLFARSRVRCDGSGECRSLRHIHGCFADTGNCELPLEHCG